MWVVGFEIGCGRGSDFNWLASISATEYQNTGVYVPLCEKRTLKKRTGTRADVVGNADTGTRGKIGTMKKFQKFSFR